jgi:hypothetical protein
MLEIVNAIKECQDRNTEQRFDLEAIEGFAVHRCGVDHETGIALGYTGPEVSDAFTGKNPEWAEVAAATNYQNAYGIMIGGNLGPPEHDGTIWQLLPLDEIGWHARRFSRNYVGIGLIADPRHQEPSPLQMKSLESLLALLCPAFKKGPYQSVRGHGEIPGSHDGSKAPGQPAACPGDLLDMHALRADVDAQILWHSREKLADSGLVLSA